MARFGMPSARPLVFALTLTSLATACVADEGLECPATGAPLLASSVEVQPEWVAGCTDSKSWTSEVANANATWTVELRRDFSGGFAFVSGLLDGVAVVRGTELILVDGEGGELASRNLPGGANWTNFAATKDGRIIVGGQSGGTPSYRVYDPSGAQVWLRLLDVSGTFGQATIVLGEDGTVWVGLTRFSAEADDFELYLQQWEVTGEIQSEVALPGVSNSAFARDGAGRFAVLDQFVELFEADGTPIGAIAASDRDYANQIVGLDDGFAYAGESDGLPVITRVDAEGMVVWQRKLKSSYVDANHYSSAIAIAALPDNGVVAVGAEDTIRVAWPDSPINEYQQPFVVALDDQGALTWGERLAVGGRAWSVAVGSGGEVYVTGNAQGSLANEYGQSDEVTWLRRYDP